MSWGAELWLNLLLLPGAGAIMLIAMKIVRPGAASVRWPGIRRVVAAGANVLSVPARPSLLRPWFLLLACALVIISLARPRWGESEKPVFQQAREVMLALDLSRSMLVHDVAPDRLSRARLLVQGLLDGLRGERVGLIVFAGTAFVQVPLSADYQILNDFLPELSPNYMPQGGTDYAGMLRAAAGAFSDIANTEHYLIVLSDGEALDDAWKQHVPELEKRAVRVIALGIGTAEGGFIPDGETGFVKDERGAVVLSRLESGTLRELAQSTSGVYRDASTWVDLPALLQETVERGRRGEFTEKRAVEQIERFQWFLAPALLLATLGLWREISIRPRARAISPPRPVARASFRRASVPPAAPSRAGARSLAVGALLASAMLGEQPLRAAAALPAMTRGDPAAPVRETIARLAATPAPAPADWLELATRSLACGQALREAGAPMEKGAIEDALLAVAFGQRDAPSLADWDSLRAALEQLLENPPKPQDEQEQEQEQEQDKKEKGEQPPPDQDQNSQSGKNDAQDEESQSGDSDQNQAGQPSEPQDHAASDQAQDEEQQQEQQQPQTTSDARSERQEQQGQKAQPPPPQQPAPEEGRLGDLKEDEADQKQEEEPVEPPAPPEAQPAQKPKPPQTRRIGGRPADDRTLPLSDPELAAALQRLRQATEHDSPARLFELLEGDRADQPTGGKDW